MSNQNLNFHLPVLLSEVISYLTPQDNKFYIDATFGAGGYSHALLASCNCTVYAFDRDPSVSNYAKTLENKYPNRFKFFNECFSQLEQTLTASNIKEVDGIIFDVGVSSMQLDQPERGFSFMHEAYLDMRMAKEGFDAAQVINNLSEEELANIIYEYGNEHASRRIARKIIIERQKQPIDSTLRLATIVRQAIGHRVNKKIDPATKTFQAIRIYVNDELNELEQALVGANNMLIPGGKLIVVSFHSLEDAIVKKFFKNDVLSNNSRYLPPIDSLLDNNKINKKYKILTKRPVTPSVMELTNNPRSRSAKLRAAQKLDVNND